MVVGPVAVGALLVAEASLALALYQVEHRWADGEVADGLLGLGAGEAWLVGYTGCLLAHVEDAVGCVDVLVGEAKEFAEA